MENASLASTSKTDEFFFCIWDSTSEAMFPFVKIDGLSNADVELLHENLQRKALAEFSIEDKAESALNVADIATKSEEQGPVGKIDETVLTKIYVFSRSKMTESGDRFDWLRLERVWDDDQRYRTEAQRSGIYINFFIRGDGIPFDDLHEWASIALEDLKWKAAQPGFKDTKTEQRDAWIYEMVIDGVGYKKIRSELDKLAGVNDWEPIGTDSGIRDRASVYAERHKLPRPQRRQKST